jgi:wyosine [tRNA(Phe)-imidazoG37] synthetase (radical SAM superfamily)
MESNHRKQGDVQRPAPNYPSETYEILVQGQLDSLWEQWFEGMMLSNVENGESGVACTLIAGTVVDQPALHGLLIKIRDLNLKLISVRRISPKKKLMLI